MSNLYTIFKRNLLGGPQNVLTALGGPYTRKFTWWTLSGKYTRRFTLGTNDLTLPLSNQVMPAGLRVAPHSVRGRSRKLLWLGPAAPAILRLA